MKQNQGGLQYLRGLQPCNLSSRLSFYTNTKKFKRNKVNKITSLISCVDKIHIVKTCNWTSLLDYFAYYPNFIYLTTLSYKTNILFQREEKRKIQNIHCVFFIMLCCTIHGTIPWSLNKMTQYMVQFYWLLGF